ncbi:MAG: S-layer homology domain-containing protein [bacterium]
MKKVLGKNVDFIKPVEYLNVYQDIGLPNQASWIQPVVETALHYGILSKDRTMFEPDRDVTRSEAFAMIMNSVCMASTQTVQTDWEESLYHRAKEEGLTNKTWETFEPNRPILRQELFLLASKAADWAERTGGCDPKPAYCFLPK